MSAKSPPEAGPEAPSEGPGAGKKLPRPGLGGPKKKNLTYNLIWGGPWRAAGAARGGGHLGTTSGEHAARTKKRENQVFLVSGRGVFEDVSRCRGHVERFARRGTSTVKNAENVEMVIDFCMCAIWEQSKKN